MVTCSKLPSEDGSVISDESERLRSSRGLMVLKVTAQQRATEEEARKKDGEREAALRATRRFVRRMGSAMGAWLGEGTRKAESRRAESVASAGGATTSSSGAGAVSTQQIAETDVMNMDWSHTVPCCDDMVCRVIAGCYGAVTTKQQ